MAKTQYKESKMLKKSIKSLLLKMDTVYVQFFNLLKTLKTFNGIIVNFSNIIGLILSF